MKLFRGLDAEKLLKSLGVDTSSGNVQQLAGYSVTFVAAYTIHKVCSDHLIYLL